MFIVDFDELELEEITHFYQQLINYPVNQISRVTHSSHVPST